MIPRPQSRTGRSRVEIRVSRSCDELRDRWCGDYIETLFWDLGVRKMTGGRSLGDATSTTVWVWIRREEGRERAAYQNAIERFLVRTNNVSRRGTVFVGDWKDRRRWRWGWWWGWKGERLLARLRWQSAKLDLECPRYNIIIALAFIKDDDQDETRRSNENNLEIHNGFWLSILFQGLSWVNGVKRGIDMLDW